MTNNRKELSRGMRENGDVKCLHIYTRESNRALFAYEYNKNKNTKSGKRTTIPSKWKHPRRRMQEAVVVRITYI